MWIFPWSELLDKHKHKIEPDLGTYDNFDRFYVLI